jgi:hypothetical protein
MQEHFCLADGVTNADASLVFNNVARRFIKDIFKHVHCHSITYYYTQVFK